MLQNMGDEMAESDEERQAREMVEKRGREEAERFGEIIGDALVKVIDKCVDIIVKDKLKKAAARKRKKKGNQE
jgi:hypothetical protein